MALSGHLQGFGNPHILVNDIEPDRQFGDEYELKWASKEQIYREADIISLHLPLTGKTKNMIRTEHLRMMKEDAIILNTARGGIINEDDLYDVLQTEHLSGAAIDVFDFEPYTGKLRDIERCLLTAHMGSMSIDCRTRMEIEATEEAVRFLIDKPLKGLVPEGEYEVQRQGL